MKKLFGGLKMSWLTVILFAVITGIYTGAVMLIPSLENTSFQDIGITFEWWVVFAVIIVVNCEKSWEAALKCFVFFLISQPLVYLTEIVFGHMTLQLAKMYYFNTWLPFTFATLPGGFIAWFCKKQNVPGAVVMGLGNAIELLMAAYYLLMTIRQFPHHILSLLVCFAAIIVMTLNVQHEKKNRIIAFTVPFIAGILFGIFVIVTGRYAPF